jgi:penicillin-binding protein 1A
MKLLAKLARFALTTVFTLFIVGVIAVLGTYLYVAPSLPSIDDLRDVRLQVPMRVYSADSRLMAEFGEMRRVPLTLDQVPEILQQAVLATEDVRFYEHPGVDWQGLARAAWVLAKTGEKRTGGSTITMQVARNFFLGREKTYIRKINEIFLALRIERHLSKREILELYLNKIYLGSRAYGVGAAAQVYYGLPIDELTLPQYAMIAGLPQAPSRANPVANPELARARRNFVLERMHTLGYIDDQALEDASAAPINARYHGHQGEIEAPYAAEMARLEMIERFGEGAYTDGYQVYTSIDSRLQESANRALRQALLEFDRRHGYRGPEAHVELPEELPDEQREQAWSRLLEDYSPVGGLAAALVTGVNDKSAEAYLPGAGIVQLEWKGLSWAKPYIDETRSGPAPKTADQILQPGDVIRLEPLDDSAWRLARVPEVGGALVALDPKTGAIVALVGGFDFQKSKFNRVTQALRQPGSNFKPFLYSAALESGLTAATLINDAPLPAKYDASLETEWRPQNYSGKFFGDTRLREALYRSRNLVSIRLLDRVGIDYVVDYATRFGFRRDQLPPNLSLALGSLVATPQQMAEAFAVLANGGYRVSSFLVDRVVDGSGKTVYRANPRRVSARCAADEVSVPANHSLGATDPSDTPSTPPPGELDTPDPEAERCAPRVMSPRNHYLTVSLLRDVIKRGTGRRALSLKRSDLAGKTGTTNDQQDAWFSGFNGDLIATAWVGYDRIRPMGRRETGAGAALPMWIKFMGEALEGRQETRLPRPPGMVTVRIDPDTGLLAGFGDKNAIFETFREENVPKRKMTYTSSLGGQDKDGASVAVESAEQGLF